MLDLKLCAWYTYFRNFRIKKNLMMLASSFRITSVGENQPFMLSIIGELIGKSNKNLSWSELYPSLSERFEAVNDSGNIFVEFVNGKYVPFMDSLAEEHNGEVVRDIFQINWNNSARLDGQLQLLSIKEEFHEKQMNEETLLALESLGNVFVRFKTVDNIF